MIYVVMSPCIGTKDTACIEPCPVDCFYDAGDRLVIGDECIGCHACVSVCPVAAILPDCDVPEDEQKSIAFKEKFFASRTPAEIEAARMEV